MREKRRLALEVEVEGWLTGTCMGEAEIQTFRSETFQWQRLTYDIYLVVSR